ncbi:hypothetical protein ACF1G0_34510 [Streptomyces sp. NPDC013953]|uniref:hypothetical protein n=1 Tax=Streptomyces sp. NPDC013953 TaxID=3364868 RepID=UPI0036F687E5
MRTRLMLTTGAATAALLGGLAAVPAAASSHASASSTAGVLGHDAYADLMEGGEFVARGYFQASGDKFILTKKSNQTYSGRTYLEYKYIKVNGQPQEGTHHGVSAVGVPVTFDHNFGEGRKVVFRICVEDIFQDPCSDWETGYA